MKLATLLCVAVVGCYANQDEARAVISASGIKAATSGGRNIVVFPGDDVLAQLANGDGWRTAIVLVNLSAARQQFILDFWRSDGTEWPLAIAGVGTGDRITGSINPGGSVTFETDGRGTLAQGWAELTYDTNAGRIGGLGVFRQSVPGRPDFEAVVPLTSLFEKQAVLIYDNTGGFSTGLALVNGHPQNSLTVTAEFRDEAGARYATETITLPPKGQTAFSMPARYSATQGRRGTVLLRSNSDVLSVLGLRFNPGGAFTSFHTLTTTELLR
jgi:hypothetical protein